MIDRPGLHALLQVALAGELDLVVAESLDRLSRNQSDIARIYQLLQHADVRVVTVEEDDIDELKIGFKGTMNALFLKSLALKTRRGLLGQVERGKMAGGLELTLSRRCDGRVGHRPGARRDRPARAHFVCRWHLPGGDCEAVEQ